MRPDTKLVLERVNNLRHDFLTRMFLRECGFFINWFGVSSTGMIWHSATYSLGIFLFVVFFFVFTIMSIFLSPYFPPQISPMTASDQVLLIETVGIAVSMMIFVELRFKRYKENIREAMRYTGQVDTIIWILTSLTTVGFGVGICVAFIRYK